MKKMNLKYLLLLSGVITMMISFSSCNDNNSSGGNSSAPAITAVYLEDAQSTVTDREVDFLRLGQTIRLEGANFIGISKVLVNGYNCYFNPTLVTNTSMIFTVFQTTVSSAIYTDPSAENTIALVKNGQTVSIPFDVRAAAPTITSISHTMPQAGDRITVYGTGLQGITSVTFPGNVAVTSGIVSDDVEGTYFEVTVPQGVSNDGGSILAIGANGGAYSPACFNYKKGLLHNFDDIQNYSWGSGIDNTALTAQIPTSGDGPKSQGGYQEFNSAGNLAGGADQRFWLNSTNIQSIMGNLPASLSTDSCGIQMDIYVDGAWNSGIIRFVMADGYGSSRYCMVYQPVYPNGAAYDQTAFVNPGCWFTITLPFSSSADFKGKTLGDVLAQMAAATYQQSGPWFENSGLKDASGNSIFDPVPATEKIYFDNIRIVSLSTPSYSDFTDE